jgi:cadmium resistance protein CadD (predicted permease)
MRDGYSLAPWPYFAGDSDSRVRRATADEVMVLTPLFMSQRTTGRPSARVIVTGRYVGFPVILVLALAAALDLQIVPDR